MDTGVSVELPRLRGDFAVAAGLDFLLVLFDAAKVRGAAFGFFAEAGLAGDNWGCGGISGAEEALPVCVVGSGGTSPATCVDAAVTLTARRSEPISRAITALSQDILTP